MSPASSTLPQGLPCTIFLAKASAFMGKFSLHPLQEARPSLKDCHVHPAHLERPHRARTGMPPVAMSRDFLSFSWVHGKPYRAGEAAEGVAGAPGPWVGSMEQVTCLCSSLMPTGSCPSSVLRHVSGLGGLSLGTSVLWPGGSDQTRLRVGSLTVQSLGVLWASISSRTW